MKDIFLSLIIIIGLLSIIYLGTIAAVISAIFLKIITGTATQSGLGEILVFAKQNIWTLYVSSFFSILLIAYKIKHEQNKKRKEKNKKFEGSLIGKPY